MHSRTDDIHPAEIFNPIHTTTLFTALSTENHNNTKNLVGEFRTEFNFQETITWHKRKQYMLGLNSDSFFAIEIKFWHLKIQDFQIYARKNHDDRWKK